MPVDQTVEGGGQLRVTPQGFAKITALLPALVNSATAGGFCLPSGSEFGVGYCGNNDGICHPGCDVHVSLNTLTTAITDPQTLTAHVDVKGTTTVPFDAGFIGSCSLAVTAQHITGDVSIGVGINNTTGELTLHVTQVANLQVKDLNFNGCSVIGDIVNDFGSFIADIFNDGLSSFASNLLQPEFDQILQSFLPDPLGIENTLDVGDLLSGVSPGGSAELEARVVPGGYATFSSGGLSLGIITGFNSDRDPSTRGSGLASEPALCVPPIEIDDLSQPPYMLTTTTRNTFQELPASEFTGSDDGSADLALGVSSTTLNLAGHHAVTSGALCLGIGESVISQLNLGTLGLLVPSVAQLDPTGSAPVLLVTRPQRPLVITVGDNTATSPALTINATHLQIDLYAFLYERYVRAFTMDLTLNLGVQLTPEQVAGGGTTIQPVLSGLSAQDVTVTVLNSEFTKETPQYLESVLPTVFDLVAPLLANIGAITVPSFAGFSLENLSIQKITTSQDTFIALAADLGTSAQMAALAPTDPFARAALDHEPRLVPATPSDGTARLVRVETPTVGHTNEVLTGARTGSLPSVTFDVDTTDSLGRPLEWSWNISGGLWRPYVAGATLVVSDRAFAWQGKYTIGLKSRVVGDYRTVHYNDATPVIIDSVAPTFDLTTVDNGSQLIIPVHDVVSEGHIEMAYGKPSELAPTTPWRASQGGVASAELANLTEDGAVAVYARDEAGNVARLVYQRVALAVTPATASGSGCNAGGSPVSGGLVIAAVLGALALAPRRRRRIAHAAGFATALTIAVGCGDNIVPACDPDECAPCGAGMVATCSKGACACGPDLAPGRIGPYQSIAAAPDGTMWVSAYAETWGDLVVTHTQGGRISDDNWDWVDGVPTGEKPTVPGSKIRGGISDPGPDVGMYTSIAVGSDGTPMVTYYDVDNASLKFAALVNGTWQIHTVDAGTGSAGLGSGSGSGAQVGLYTSLSLRTDDGRPGVAYLAHVEDGSGEHAEVRFASAQTTLPTQASDWQTWVVDTGDVPATEADGENFPLPGGLGLFCNLTRDANQVPEVAYYDRGVGALKLAKFDVSSGEFDPPLTLTTTDVNAGWTPSALVDSAGVTHVAYVDATHNDLNIISDQAGDTPTVIDDGYRIDGSNADGLPEPTFDFVGYNAQLVADGGSFFVAYQDSTIQQLLLAKQAADGTWSHEGIAGGVVPFPGAYGFFASATTTASAVWMSNWVIDQPTGENWVEVFSKLAHGTVQ